MTSDLISTKNRKGFKASGGGGNRVCPAMERLCYPTRCDACVLFFSSPWPSAKHLFGLRIVVDYEINVGRWRGVFC